MSESSNYLALRKERKERAAKVVEDNAKAAAKAKAKAQGKVTSEREEAFATSLEDKKSKRAASYQRATSLPPRDELTDIES